jgi:hypothetical protein
MKLTWIRANNWTETGISGGDGGAVRDPRLAHIRILELAGIVLCEVASIVSCGP